MSRIGQKPLTIPSGVTATLSEGTLKVTGPKGSLELVIKPQLEMTIDGETMKVAPKDSSRQTKALHGLYRQLASNMLVGVSTGFTKNLEMKGTGYRAVVEGTDLVLSVGFSHPVRIPAPEGIAFKVEKNVNLSVEGIDRELVGETAARIRAVRKPEPYKGKGIRYAGEQVRLKPGKAAKAAA